MCRRKFTSLCRMPLLIHRDISDETILGIWKIEESEDWFRSQLKLDEDEKKLIDSIRNPQRKIHWLSSRLLIRILLDSPAGHIHLTSDQNGMPVVQNYDVKISISHSSQMSALLMSRDSAVGIDIEKISPKIERIQEKFLSAEELKNISYPHRLVQLYIYWCSKEAMYKLDGRRQLDFRKNLFINPFMYSHAGKIHGRIEKGLFHLPLEITFEKIDDYMMAYTMHDQHSA